ncbi:o-succinylbenzoate synthase [Thermomicrobium sp. 4228-Ro]|uniref:mandelate racemase/muconate lactonizing enzyme family protein n=1 Tax=Thermomicrobium sp. 4228-Ro TaxID=2993937 RepID=UPI0022496CBD|nr:o-succinylbenzoate synthase [Thermomicrobium sp. 4228-Ro]MCX2728310.1 o-succinylbenzoate synthase [Thermomicrobium sp. 4228-Ro]
MSAWRLQWRPYELLLREPLETAGGTVRVRHGLLVALESADGCVGSGDVAFWPGTEETGLPEAVVWLEQAATALRIAAHPASVLANFTARTPAALAARTGLETALLDWQARQAGVPLARWLRSDATDRLPVNALLGRAGWEAMVAQARAAVAAGFRTLKLKVTLSPADAELVAAVRATVGREIALRLDANGRGDPESALAFARVVARFDIEYLEQPVATLEELAVLRRCSPIPVAADEALTGADAVERALALEAADVLVLKLPLLGGPRAVLAAAERAGKRGVDVVVTSMLESGVGLAAAVHTAAALGAARAHGLATGQLLASLGIVESLEPVEGALSVPAGQGLGVTVQLAGGEGVA